MKTVWMVSGNKGGVGKSLFALALASALEFRGEHFAVLDGDGRNPDVFASFDRKIPARWADFRRLRPDRADDMLDGEYEALIHSLLLGSEHLIINTPDGADETLLTWFDLTLQHTEVNGYRFKLCYLISDRPDGLNMLPRLSERFACLYPIRNLHFGPPALFAAFNREYSDMFLTTLDLPRLRGEEVRMLFDVRTYPAEAVNMAGGAFPVLTRTRLLRWQLNISEALSDVIDSEIANRRVAPE